MATYYYKECVVGEPDLEDELNGDVQRICACRVYWINEGFVAADFEDKSTWDAALVRGPVYRKIQVGDTMDTTDTFGVSDLFVADDATTDVDISGPLPDLQWVDVDLECEETVQAAPELDWSDDEVMQEITDLIKDDQEYTTATVDIYEEGLNGIDLGLFGTCYDPTTVYLD